MGREKVVGSGGTVPGGSGGSGGSRRRGGVGRIDGGRIGGISAELKHRKM